METRFYLTDPTGNLLTEQPGKPRPMSSVFTFVITRAGMASFMKVESDDGKRLIAIPGANVTPGVAVVMDASEVVTAAARRAAEAHRKREARAGRKVERSKPKITLPKLKCLEGET